jgi:nitroreductase
MSEGGNMSEKVLAGNDILRTIAERYSCRAYTGEPMEREKLEAIALAGAQAPSAMNSQRWRLIVVSDKALLDEFDAAALEVYRGAKDTGIYERVMSRGGKVFYEAPAAIIVAISREGRFNSDMDAGIVAENIALAAASLGVASCINLMAAAPFVGEQGDAWRSRLSFPEGFDFGVAVLLGYAVEPGVPHEPDADKIVYI